MTRFIQGPPGPKGPPGIPGPQGYTGLVGSPGVTGTGGPGQNVPARLMPPDANTRIRYMFGEPGLTISNIGPATGCDLTLGAEFAIEEADGFFSRSSYANSSTITGTCASGEVSSYTSCSVHFWFQLTRDAAEGTGSVSFGLFASGTEQFCMTFTGSNLLWTVDGSDVVNVLNDKLDYMGWHHAGLVWNNGATTLSAYMDGLLVDELGSGPTLSAVDEIRTVIANASIEEGRIENTGRSTDFMVEVYRRGYIHDPV